MRVYLSGEIHTDWRDEIIASSKDLDITFEGPVTDHELSDDCGVMIMGKEKINFGMIIREQNSMRSVLEKVSWMQIL